MLVILRYSEGSLVSSATRAICERSFGVPQDDNRTPVLLAGNSLAPFQQRHIVRISDRLACRSRLILHLNEFTMRVFHCDHCDLPIFFENTFCGRCGHKLAYLPDLKIVASLDPADG